MIPDEKRNQLLSQIPKDYNPRLHLGFIFGLSLFYVLLAIIFLGTPTLLWSLILPFLLVFSLSEYLIHRYVLHKPQPYLYKIFSFHQKEHHLLFDDNNMKIKSWNYLFYTLIPFSLYINASIISIFFAVFLSLFSFKIALLFILSFYTFHLLYEFQHILFHMIDVKWMPWHKIHHAPKNMIKYNFNVNAIPVYDFLLGTLKKD